jgi:peptide subunit release factor 1 (eRF1)
MTGKPTLEEWERAAEFYRQCKADPKSHETFAMRDAVEWLLDLAARTGPQETSIRESVTP